MASTFDDALYWYTKSEDHFILEGKLIQTLLRTAPSVFFRFPKLRRSFERELGLHLHKLLLHDGIRSNILSSSPLCKLRATHTYLLPYPTPPTQSFGLGRKAPQVPECLGWKR